jgi:hypothetical protein
MVSQRRGLAHFAQSSEQNVPVPFSKSRGATAIAIALHGLLMSRPGDMQKRA